VENGSELEQPPQQEYPGYRTGHPDHRPPGHVPHATVPKLMGNDHAQLRWLRPVEKRVVDDHPPGLSQPRDVGVLLAGPPARVCHEDVSDRDARPIGQCEQVIGQHLIPDRPETVEDRLQQDGCDEAQKEHDDRGTGSDHGRP
jgi:hypothetical protein